MEGLFIAEVLHAQSVLFFRQEKGLQGLSRSAAGAGDSPLAGVA
jgi:hypothetical protein